MNTTETSKGLSPEKKTALCIVMSMFYFAMLAYPFGVTAEGYVWQKVLIAGLIFFAISIPAWIVNLKREFYDETASEAAVEDIENINASKIGEIARTKNWLTVEDISQILFCQGGESGSKFGEVAVKRNYLTPQQVDTLLCIQALHS